jgi:hypothetical protein
VRQTVQDWQRSPDLAGIRDAALVVQLPAAERQACRRFWADVVALDGEALRNRGSPVVRATLEAELLSVAESKDCGWMLQSMSGWKGGKWSNDWQVFCKASKSGYLEFELDLPRAGRYRLAIQLTRAPDYGIVEVRLGGSTIGKPYDGYHPLVVPPGAVAFGIVELQAGKQRLRFTAVDRNPKSTNYFTGIDSLTLEPVQQEAGLASRDREARPARSSKALPGRGGVVTSGRRPAIGTGCRREPQRLP